VIEFSDAFVTVNAAVPETLPDVAVIVVFPAASALATPFVPDVLLIVATAGDDELQVTELVRFCVLPSLKVPFATNCAVVLGAIDGVEVVTAIELNVGGGGGPTWPPPEPPPQPDNTTANASNTTPRARFTQTSQRQPKNETFPLAPKHGQMGHPECWQVSCQKEAGLMPVLPVICAGYRCVNESKSGIHSGMRNELHFRIGILLNANRVVRRVNANRVVRHVESSGLAVCRTRNGLFVAAGPVSRILSAGSLRQDGHSSGPPIAERL
jgi:hypothetical protein